MASPGPAGPLLTTAFPAYGDICAATFADANSLGLKIAHVSDNTTGATVVQLSAVLPGQASRDYPELRKGLHLLRITTPSAGDVAVANAGIEGDRLMELMRERPLTLIFGLPRRPDVTDEVGQDVTRDDRAQLDYKMGQQCALIEHELHQDLSESIILGRSVGLESLRYDISPPASDDGMRCAEQHARAICQPEDVSPPILEQVPTSTKPMDFRLRAERMAFTRIHDDMLRFRRSHPRAALQVWATAQLPLYTVHRTAMPAYHSRAQLPPCPTGSYNDDISLACNISACRCDAGAGLGTSERLASARASAARIDLE
jgi:hypothetical protein